MIYCLSAPCQPPKEREKIWGHFSGFICHKIAKEREWGGKRRGETKREEGEKRKRREERQRKRRRELLKTTKQDFIKSKEKKTSMEFSNLNCKVTFLPFFLPCFHPLSYLIRSREKEKERRRPTWFEVEISAENCCCWKKERKKEKIQAEERTLLLLLRWTREILVSQHELHKRWRRFGFAFGWGKKERK